MRLKKPNSKNAIIVSSNKDSLRLIMNWIILKKVIKSLGETFEINELYAVAVRSKIPKKDLKSIVKDRFGSHVEVI